MFFVNIFVVVNLQFKIAYCDVTDATDAAQVFLKEHSRGLYSLLWHWLVSDTSLLCLRTVHTCLYGLITYKMVELRDGRTYFIFYSSVDLIG